MKTKAQTKVNISMLLIGMTLSSVFILGLTTVWGDFATNYGVTSKSLEELNKIDEIQEEAKEGSQTIQKEGGVFQDVFGSALNAGQGFITLTEKLDAMLTAGVELIGLPEWVATLMWTIAGIIITITIIKLLSGRDI